jgi:hypothetical protein
VSAPRATIKDMIGDHALIQTGEGSFKASMKYGVVPRQGDQIEIPMKDGGFVRVVVSEVVWRQDDEGNYEPHTYCGEVAED